VTPIIISIGDVPIGKLTSFTLAKTSIPVRTIDIPTEGIELWPAGRQTYTVTLTKSWLHPKLRPLPWGTRNPPVHVLRQWWVWHLGKTNRSFKRTRLAQVRRLWRAKTHEAP